MSKTLILDNGSYSIKIGYSGDLDPQIVSNAIVGTKDNRLILGKLIDKNLNISGCSFKRPYEKNQITSWEIEKLIWDYCFNCDDLKLKVDPLDTNLILTEAPLTLPKISKNTDQIVFEEYGFLSLYKNVAALFVPFSWSENERLYGEGNVLPVTSYKDYQLVIDSGFDATYVIPIVYGNVYWEGVRKLDIGGRFLTGVLRELISFRYYDVTDEPILVNNIKEQTCFVPLNYMHLLEQLKKDKASGQKITDSSTIVEYVLPDFKTTTKGFLLTDAKRKSLTVPVADLQIMKLYDERFSVPETLFDPAISNVKHKNGLVNTIYESIYGCPELLRPLLTSNIICVGGNFNIPGFKPRLKLELKQVLPVEWDIRIGISDTPTTYSWKSANELAKNEVFDKVKITKEDYFEKGWNYLNDRFGCKLKGW